MGIDVALELRRGESLAIVGDPHSFLPRLLPSVDDETFPLLRFVDWYGNTVFNSIQMPQFISEWERLIKKTDVAEELKILEEILVLANKCKDDIHLYIKFYGD
ncbi:MAG: hypothetical protein OEV59_00670 [Deltaproteobacteria bacterium]|nr:hypothetical protein [Deltaproteobacteria bacterium]